MLILHLGIRCCCKSLGYRLALQLSSKLLTYLSVTGRRPESLTAKLDFWHKGPSRALVSLQCRRLADENANSIQGNRAKACFSPIKMPGFQARLCIASPEGSRKL